MSMCKDAHQRSQVVELTAEDLPAGGDQRG